MPALFAYGVLTSTEVMCALTGANVASSGVAAILSNHRRVKLNSRSYPTVVKAAGSEVVGMVFPNLDSFSWCLIDAFVGVEYVLDNCIVRTLAGDTVQARIFRLRDELSSLGMEEEWDFEEWQTNHLAKAVSDCVEVCVEVEAVRKREIARGLGQAKFDEETMLMIAGDDEADLDIEASIRG
jgi:hypothetical protein